MKKPQQSYGAFANLTPKGYRSIADQFEKTNPIMTLGEKPRFSVNVTPNKIAQGAFNLIGGPLSIIPSAISAYGSYSAEKAAREAQGLPTGMLDTAKSMFSDSLFDQARAAADVNQDGVVDQGEARAFGTYSAGLTPEQVGMTVAYDDPNQTFANAPDYTAPSRSNIIGSKTYDAQFAAEASRKAQERAEQERTGGQDNSDSKYICTALHEMGDMDSQVFAYDLIYGQLVDPVVHSGYALWGIPLAEKVKKKGIVYRIVKPLALAWANQMSHEMSGGEVGKKSITGHILMKYGEKICRQIGLRRVQWQLST
jgi:hypothetical protein